jgi:mRNA interferase MazF
MQRGDLYLVPKPNSLDPKRQRAYVVVSRQRLIDSNLPSVICPPVFSQRLGLPTQVDVGVEEGLKHDSTICCDELMSLPKFALTRYLGRLGLRKTQELDNALATALELIK